MDNTRTQTDTIGITVPGGQIHAKRWTPQHSAGTPPLVLLHDSLGSVDLWRTFPGELAHAISRPVIAYDRLGFGKSDSRQALHSPEFISEEAITYFPAIKQQLNLDRYALLGHSVGGAMAINIAATDADCQAVITIAAQAFVEPLTLDGIRQAKAAFAQPGQLERLQKWHGDKAQWVLHAWTGTWLSDAFAGWNLDSVIHQVQCPILAIHGDSDEYGSLAFPEYITRHAGGPASMVIIEKGRHTPHREEPATVIAAIQDFLIRHKDKTHV